MSKLGEEIKKLRLERKWNQAQASKACGLNQSVLSRIESGDSGSPNLETLQKLGTGFGVSLEYLSGLASANGLKGFSDLRVGFAHCLWAAPVIPLVMGGPTPEGLTFTSYGSQTESEFAYEPYWYGPKAGAKLRVGPFFDGEVEALPGPDYERWPDDSRLVPYTAPDLDHLLTRSKIDCVVAAKNVFDAHDALLIRCARLLDCVGSGSALLMWQKNWKERKPFVGREGSVLDLSWRLAEAVRQPGFKIQTYYPAGTNAEKNLSFLRDWVVQGKLQAKEIRLRDWASLKATLARTLHEEGAFLCICWEPFLSGMKKALSGPGVGSIVATHLSAGKPVPYLSFDLMFTRQNAQDWFASGAVRRFLSLVGKNIEQIKQAITKGEEKAPVVQQIAAYLGMGRQGCLQALSEIDFGLLYYPEWLEYAGVFRTEQSK